MKVMGLLFMALGLLGAVAPRAAWYLAEGWKFRDVEPSDLALVMNRVLGVVFLVAGILALLS